LLAEHRSDGEYVLSSARMVGDEEDHSIWRQSRRAWLASTADVLFAHFPSEHLELDAGEPAGHAAGWKGQYESELRTVREGLRLLDSLAERVATTSLERRHEGHEPLPWLSIRPAAHH
jgi:hypothetical protein